VKVDGKHHRTIWLADDGRAVEIIDQTKLPHEFAVARLESLEDAARAIREMRVRGAPLIGVTAAYGLGLALRRDAGDGEMLRASKVLEATRPTAVNLSAALRRMRARLASIVPAERVGAAYAFAAELADADVEQNRAIGRHGFALLQTLTPTQRADAIQIMTHCNAGWLATVDFGTALAPVYAAQEAGVRVHVWVSETRPRNQGAFLTAWELLQQGVEHTVIVDSAAGHLMRRGDVDAVLVGTDRTTSSGDVANKIGTYVKAVAARDCAVPFFVAVPSTSIDWSLLDGAAIPIEERASREITHVSGRTESGEIESVELIVRGSGVRNFGFDVTPARLVTALITERGVCDASREGLLRLFPDHGTFDENGKPS
jgi:methylthioribose-1-phosphate isomerase